MDPYWTSEFLMDLMRHVGACLSDRDARELVISLFRTNKTFESVLTQLHTADYHALIKTYEEVLRPKTGVDVFPASCTETRVNTRTIQSNFVDLIREQRAYIDNELKKANNESVI
jgi:hypothetical protein